MTRRTTALIATLALLALGAPRAQATHIVAEDVSDDFLITHVLNVPIAMTKLLVDQLALGRRLTDGTDHLIVTIGRVGQGGAFFGLVSVNSAGAASGSKTTRLRISVMSTRAPYQGSVKVKCSLLPEDGRFVVGEPPAGEGTQSGGGDKSRKRRDEYLRPGPTVTPAGAIVVEGTFP